MKNNKLKKPKKKGANIKLNMILVEAKVSVALIFTNDFAKAFFLLSSANFTTIILIGK